MIKLIVFDLWGTLATRSDPTQHFSSTIKKEFKLKEKKEKIISIFEQTVQTKYWEVEYDAYKEFAINLGIKPTDTNTKKILAMRDKAEANIKVFNFTIELLKQLKKKKYKTGLLTNSSIFIYKMVKEKTKILNNMDYPLFSFQIGVVKPNPIIYLEIQRISNLKNKEILMIGDNYYKDVKTPIELGWNAIHFTNYEQLKIDLKKYKIEI